MRSRTGLASPVENQACGIAKYPRLRVHRHEARVTPAERRTVYLDHRTNGWMVGIRKLASTADQCQSSGSAGRPNSCQEFESTPGPRSNGANPQEMPEV